MLNLYSFLALLTLPGLVWVYYRSYVCRIRLIDTREQIANRVAQSGVELAALQHGAVKWADTT